jgi:hypothetical protein
VRLDEAGKLIGRAARSRRDRLGDLEEAAHALQTDELERALLGGKIIVQARLPDAEHVGDVLGGGPVKTARREDTGSGLDDLGLAPPRAPS